MSAAPHRTLAVTSPHTHGPDVLAFQKAINRLSKPEIYDLPHVAEDGEFGTGTLGHYKDSGARGVGYWLGAADSQIGKGVPVSRHLQQIIRDPRRRYPTELVRGKARYIRRRRALRAHRGPKAALAWCRAQVDAHVREQPSGSNTGPQVSVYQRNFGIDGSPWCGAFVGTAMLHAGLHPSVRIVYVPYIAQDYRRVSWDDRQPGDLVCFNFGAGLQHVGMLAGDREHTFEGNTSPGEGGSQDNGGVVAYRLRDRSTMAVIVRPPWR